jgi:hypothetical protein
MARVNSHKDSVKNFLFVINRYPNDLLKQSVKVRVVDHSVKEILFGYDVFFCSELLGLLLLKLFGLGKDSSEVVDHLFAQINRRL